MTGFPGLCFSFELTGYWVIALQNSLIHCTVSLARLPWERSDVHFFAWPLVGQVSSRFWIHVRVFAPWNPQRSLQSHLWACQSTHGSKGCMNLIHGFLCEVWLLGNLSSISYDWLTPERRKEHITVTFNIWFKSKSNGRRSNLWLLSKLSTSCSQR